MSGLETNLFIDSIGLRSLFHHICPDPEVSFDVHINDIELSLSISLVVGTVKAKESMPESENSAIDYCKTFFGL